MRKAIIKDGVVINIIETGNNGVNGIQLPLDQILWDCTQYAVGIGDKFIDGVFYRENEPVEYIPSTEEKIAQLTAELIKAKQETESLKSTLSTSTNDTAKLMFAIMDKQKIEEGVK